MAELNTEAKLKQLLKKEKIQLWSPPYTGEDNQPGQQPIQVWDQPTVGGPSFFPLRRAHDRLCVCCQELAERYAPLLCLQAAEVEAGLESVRVQAVKRGKGNKVFRETNVATLELLLPRDSKKVERETVETHNTETDAVTCRQSLRSFKTAASN